MLTKSYSHYESLNVTRDAPAEVIRAAYRSLSQKHHPDKNVGNHEAEQMMMRLNAAYSVLSDDDQREQYDLQLLNQEGSLKRKADTLLGKVHKQVRGRNGRLIGMVLGGAAVVLAPISWMVHRDNQAALQFERSMIYTASMANAPGAEAPAAAPEQNEAPAAKSASGGKSRVAVIQMDGPSGLGGTPAETPLPAAAPKAPAAASATAKVSEYQRLTEMLKGMGLGLHKLDLPGMASNAKPAPAKAPEPVKAAEPAKARAASVAPELAVASIAPPEASRAREEVRQPAAEPARNETKAVAEASKAGAAAVASASAASHAPRSAVIAEARNCTPPAYPFNAYRNGETGTVLLALLVGSDGRVLESKIQKSSGSSELDKAARKALSLCKFKPAESQTEPTWANLSYVWSID